MFKVGDLVYSEFYGHGTVIKFHDRTEEYPIVVRFDNGIQDYTLTGAWAEAPLVNLPRDIRKLTKLERALR